MIAREYIFATIARPSLGGRREESFPRAHYCSRRHAVMANFDRARIHFARLSRDHRSRSARRKLPSRGGGGYYHRAMIHFRHHRASVTRRPARRKLSSRDGGGYYRRARIHFAPPSLAVGEKKVSLAWRRRILSSRENTFRAMVARPSLAVGEKKVSLAHIIARVAARRCVIASCRVRCCAALCGRIFLLAGRSRIFPRGDLRFSRAITYLA